MMSTFQQVIVEKKRFENRLLLPNKEICWPHVESEKLLMIHVKISLNFELIIS